MRQKKDRIFVLTLGLILANLAYYFAGVTVEIFANPTFVWYWAVLIANGMAIFGTLWLLRAYRKGRKNDKKDKSYKANKEA